MGATDLRYVFYIIVRRVMEHIFDLSGRAAIVTGSSRGIGRAVAEAFAALGANVVISSRNIAACRKVAEEINARSQGRAVAIEARIGHKEDVIGLRPK